MDELVQQQEKARLNRRVLGECPVHLASLAAQLVAFERYAARCQSETPEDEVFHEHITAGTARARGLIEVLLQDVLRHEENSTPEPR